MKPIEIKTPALNDYVDLRTLQRQVVQTFPTVESIKWFVRQHRAILVRQGALVAPTGHLRFHPQLFQQAAIEIGRAKALRTIAE